jgi:hypothetical protein
VPRILQAGQGGRSGQSRCIALVDDASEASARAVVVLQVALLIGQHVAASKESAACPTVCAVGHAFSSIHRLLQVANYTLVDVEADWRHHVKGEHGTCRRANVLTSSLTLEARA